MHVTNNINIFGSKFVDTEPNTALTFHALRQQYCTQNTTSLHPNIACIFYFSILYNRWKKNICEMGGCFCFLGWLWVVML